MKNNFLILDCFVDEPACFGVPPFISPYPRYIYGALVDAGVSNNSIKYYTIDYIRKTDYLIDEYFDMIFLIGGAVVPGKYLGAKIGSLSEINTILNKNKNLQFSVGGLISSVVSNKIGNANIINKDIEKFAHTYAGNKTYSDSYRNTDEIAKWSKLGSPVVKEHPDFPDIICEIETSRGCPRKQHCSFCSEGLIKTIQFRDEEDIISEIDALIDNGISKFRIGRQADILQFKSNFEVERNGFPMPGTKNITDFFYELKKRRDNGKIDLLNIDNANPGTIINFPKESSLIIEAIVEAITPGDTISLGIESFDQTVIENNNLKIAPDQVIEVIKIINDIGGGRVNGIPILLPGINLIHGLKGETSETFKINYNKLLEIMNQNLLVKRINIRKLLPFPETQLHLKPFKISSKVENRFKYFREKIRSHIDYEMLKKIYPTGTILRKNKILESFSNYSYGKQIQSYSITSKFIENLKLNKFYDGIVIDHNERSLSLLSLPIDINHLDINTLSKIHGLSKKQASDIILARPFKNEGETKKFTGSINEKIIENIKII